MKPEYITVSFSGGKDSTAMLLHMMELGEHIDEVINVDTGMEFPAMYEHIEDIHKRVEAHGIKYTTLRNDKSFEYVMLHQEIKSDKFGTHYGFGWPTPVIRWCTRHMKLDLLNQHCKELREKYTLIECIGLAADELMRLSRPANQAPRHRHPLVEWGWSEEDCLQYCIERGGAVEGWQELYRTFNRVSCWCCPLAPISELRKLWSNYPELWAKLQQWEDYMNAHPPYYAKFKQDLSVADLTARFEREDKARRNQRTLDIFGGME